MSLLCAQLDNLCRTCTENSFNLLNLFEYRENDETLADKIFVCTQVHISNQVDRPSKMCNSCVLQLERAYEFHKLVKDSEQIFQKMVSSGEAITTSFTVPEIKMEIDQDDSTMEQVATALTPPVLSDVSPEVETKRPEIECTPFKPCERGQNKGRVKKKVTTTKKRNKDVNAKIFECYKCREQFPSYWRTSVHLKQHAAGEFKCKVCGSRFILREQFNKHLCQSVGSDIKCSYCGETFTATVALLNHLEHSHDEKTLFKCGKCAQFFSMELLKQYHIMIQHNNVETEDNKQFECGICNKRFGTKVSLRNHEEIHSDAKRKQKIYTLFGLIH